MRLRELRKQRNWSMKQLGEMVGCSESTISLYETGKREPGFETLLKFGELFNVSVDFLLGNSPITGQEEKPTPMSRPNLDDADIAFYERYSRLSEDEKEDMRDFLELMENRRKRREKGE